MDQKDRTNLSQFLSGLLEERTQKNHSYSLRALARDLDMNPSDISRFINCKAYPGLQGVTRMAKALDQQGVDVDSLLHSVTADLRERAQNREIEGASKSDF